MDTKNSDLTALYAAHLPVVAQRAAAALKSTGYDALLVHSGVPPGIFMDDHNYGFKAHAEFKIWAPLLNAPDSFIYFAPGQRPILLFNSPDDYWHQSARVPDTWWTRHFDIHIVATRNAAREQLRSVAGSASSAYVGDVFPELLDWRLAAINPEHVLHALHFARAAKTTYEIACMRVASATGARAHRAAAAAFESGASELEIELAFIASCAQREQELPYNPIIALNEHAAVLHYQHLEHAKPAQHLSLLIDAGTSFAGYASDITRTHVYPALLAGRDREQAAAAADFMLLIEQVDALQQRLCAMVRPGTPWVDVHTASYRGIAEVLLGADIIRGDVDAATDSGLPGVFYPHGIGHLLGIQVHDVGGTQGDTGGKQIPRPAAHPTLRLTRVLAEGFVVTVEPGLYFIDSLLASARNNGLGRQINWPRVEQLRPFGGVRIEDNIVCRTAVSENLTRDALRQLQ